MAETIWLTDGKTYLGPYLDTETDAIRRGAWTLRYNHDAQDVYRVQAKTRQAARQAFDARKVK
jgi:hypothetical protein